MKLKNVLSIMIILQMNDFAVKCVACILTYACVANSYCG